MSDRMRWIKAIIEKWGSLEDDQVTGEESEEALAQRCYVVVEHGRDASRRWYNGFDDLEEALAYAVERVTEDEWGFTAAYDLDTGEELGLRFRAEVVGRKAIECEEDK